ncbi:MAG TPA: SusC/RagA family TonB-linked outer membrane protein [Puia sp.]|nr:SusC/RagA family TonB-linked outer membrane protein [Puia sp.]
MRKFLSLLAVLVLCSILALAQKREVTGRVTDANGNPVPGATVKIKGSKTGTSADANGTFKISVGSNAVLVISGVGFEAKEVDVKNSEAVTVSLSQASSSLSEVVVTAQGITRTKKALGYAVTTVDKKDLELRSEGDIGRVLNGKVAGLDVLNTSGISGSGTNISIRGVSTINGGGTTPLFIVDGVPFDASNNSQGNFQYGGGTSTSSRFLDLDPNEIESVNVLKGLAAATLYGEQGRNGVILVTTKNGSSRKTNKKFEVTASQSFFANQVANLPDYENTYGGGFDLVPSAAFSNWGAKFTNPPAQLGYSPSYQAAYPDLYGSGKTQDYKAYNNVKDFFRTGLVSTTSINIASSGQNTTFNASYTYTGDNGFTPNNRVYKNNFGLGGTAKLANKLTLNGVINFATTDFQTPLVGANGGGGGPDVTSVFGFLIFTPRSINLMGLPFENPVDHSSIYYRGDNSIENPRWTAKNALSGDATFRTYGTLGLTYEILKKLSVNYRFGLDIYTENQTTEVNKGGISGGAGYVNGLYRTTSAFNSILNHKVTLNYNTEFANNFSLNVVGGAEIRHDNYSQSGLRSTYQIVYGLFDHSNFISHDINSEGGYDLDYETQKITAGVFASADLGYKDYLYLNVSGRNDWVSTLESSNRHLFYPGVSLSFIPTQAIEGWNNNKTVNYLKLRAGYSTSAHFPDPYQTRAFLNLTTNAFVDNAGNVVNVGSVPNLVPNPNLKPELLRETEVGIEGKFFDNRISLDLTGYFRTATNQILNRQLDASTGYTSTTINAGAVDNKGIEANLGLVVVKSRDWRWELNGILTVNRSKVHGMPDDIKQIELGGYSGGPGSYAINGKPLGILQGNYVLLDTGAGSHSTGKRIVDDNGYYVGSSTIAQIGDPNPKYKLTGVSTLSYKNFSFRMQWDYTHGGDMWSNTVRTLLARGVSKDTDFDRTLPFTIPNTVLQDGSPNNIQQSVDNIYFNAIGFGPASITVWDATVIRLRELSLSYSVSPKALKNTPFGGVQLSLTGNNLWYLAPNFPKYSRFDPESNSLGISGAARGIDLFAGPSSRRFGASLRISF